MERSASRFSLLQPSSIKGMNAFDRIDSSWMLITAEHNGKANPMTANRGTVGVLWGKPVVSFFVRPQRFTNSLLESASRLSLSFLGKERKEALRICGSISGKDTDKFREASLTCMHYGSVPYIGESEYVFICKKLYSDIIKKSCIHSYEILDRYKSVENDLHKLYVCEIEKILARK